jgi:transcriptional regulator with XRE-family HTH domain
MIDARRGAGLTQQGLAKRLGKHQSFVAKYEGGERRLDVVEFLVIAGAIGADPMKLLRRLIRRKA